MWEFVSLVLTAYQELGTVNVMCEDNDDVNHHADVDDDDDVDDDGNGNGDTSSDDDDVCVRRRCSLFAIMHVLLFFLWVQNVFRFHSFWNPSCSVYARGC